MKLVSFSATNYRSITEAHEIALEQHTVLLGKNNEGKSNISNALNCAISILRALSKKAGTPFWARIPPAQRYSWSRDFPIQLQDEDENLESKFKLTFALDDEELIGFWIADTPETDNTVTIEISIGCNNRPRLEVDDWVVQGPKDEIIEFISQHISVNYIPSIRTEQNALRVIADSLTDRLSELEENEEYRKAMDIMSALQQEVLNDIASSIKTPLKEFMPKIKDVSLQIEQERRRSSLGRSVDIVIDDGTPTTIKLKGDGVKSLTAMALLKENAIGLSTPVIIIEEPEAHLHPGAINQLKSIIEGLSENNQVIVTTHSPLFVARENIARNIIVGNGMARAATDLKEIREILGIRVSDNLSNFAYALLVEGEDDKKALEHILPLMSQRIETALEENFLAICSLDGASGLSYGLTFYNNMLCTCMVLLDDDNAGRQAFKKAESQKLLSFKDVTFTSCDGMNEAEFEDCIQPEVYLEGISKEFGCDLSRVPDFKSSSKWSDRVKKSFKKLGKPWDDVVEQKVKAVVVQEILKKENANEILISQKRIFLDNLVRGIESMIADS